MLSGGDWLPIIVALVRMFSQAIPLKSRVRQLSDTFAF